MTGSNGAPSAPPASDVLILGAGISGMTTAWALTRSRPDWKVSLVECASRPGGVMRSETVGGCVFEWGPNGFLDSEPRTLELVRELGLQDRLQPASEHAASRYLYCHGELIKLPVGPKEFLRSNLLSRRGRLRVLTEPFRGPGTGDEESVFGFLSRRFGPEAAAIGGDAISAGIFAGDPRRLSVAAALPALPAMEREHGSIFRAMSARRKLGRPRPTLTSFAGGMETLARRLSDRLADCLSLETRVKQITRNPSGYHLEGTRQGAPWRADTRRLVLTVPASTARCLLEPLAPRLACLLGEIPIAGISVAGLVYDRAQIAHPLDGFGFLVPRGQGPRLLGCLWVGSIFPEHVSGNRIMLRAMIGGSRDPEGALLSESRTVELAQGELERILGITGSPVATQVARHPRGIPQYELGHLDRVRALDAETARMPGFHLGGNALRGVAVNDCIREGWALAERVIDDGAPGQPAAQVVESGAV